MTATVEVVASPAFDDTENNTPTKNLIELQRPEVVEVHNPLDPAAGSNDD